MRFFAIFIIGVLCSFFLFPISFTFLPGINTKMLLAVFGAAWFLFERLPEGGLSFSKELLGALGLSTVFSLVCFFAADYNGTVDYSYATYIFSAIVWLFSAYAIIAFIRQIHGTVNLRLLTLYLAGVCLFQCVIALVMDRVEVVKSIVNAYVNIDQNFFTKVDRLYGIGAALDPAGVRFSIVLILIAIVLSKNVRVQQNKGTIAYLILSFLIIIGLGNMISRTTTIGAVLGVLILALSAGLEHFIIKRSMLKTYGILLGFLCALVPIGIYLYQTDDFFHEQIRFAFEGFFNWVEGGTWETGSTNKLNAVMWVWPEDFKTWLIGTGRFGLYEFSTDIGYCRFILYCGLIGFSIFSIFMIYHPIVLYKRFYNYRFAFLCLAVLTFVIWVKVATDIFFIYALFYWIEKEDEEADILSEEDEEEEEHEEYENNLLYSGDI